MENTDYSMYKVLIVDDIPVNIMLIKGMLSGMHFNLISANSGQEAIEKAINEKPDVILMDVLMPGMNGYECTRAIRSNHATSDIPIVIVSALSSDSDMKEGLAAGANDFLTKPIIKERIVNCILNQINLSENAKIKDSTLAFNDKSMRDGITSVFVYLAGMPNSMLTHNLTLLTAGIPMSLIDNSLADTVNALIQQQASEEFAKREFASWAAEHIKTKDIITKKLSLKNLMDDLTSKFKPLFTEKKLNVLLNINDTMNISTDPELFWALITNMLINISNDCASTSINVSSIYEEKLLTLSMTTTCGTLSTTESTEMGTSSLNMQIAVQIAEKLGGAIVSNQLDNGGTELQLILPA